MADVTKCHPPSYGRRIAFRGTEVATIPSGIDLQRRRRDGSGPDEDWMEPAGVVPNTGTRRGAAVQHKGDKGSLLTIHDLWFALQMFRPLLRRSLMDRISHLLYFGGKTMPSSYASFQIEVGTRRRTE